MSDTVIEVEGVSKRYLLGAREKAGSFREAVSNLLAAPWRRLGRMAAGGGSEEFWALKDVSFTVRRGEVVGVIGRNGAGKSTLLKVLSRITPPTSGRVRLRGRVASLLEVGTGFHPELTGRENIYLNGAILGMSTAEIRRKFDEIVAFAEVEQFLDTPVKRYSSGMYVRLAFAVAAHLEPEILIVDEVLAVGDAAFQKKCLGKMKEVSTGQGRTVLFVSHNMAAVQSLCTRAVVMVAGTPEYVGSVHEGVRHYLNPVAGNSGHVCEFPARVGTPRMTKAWVESNGRPSGMIPMGEPISLFAEFEMPERSRPKFGWVLTNEDGVRLLCANNRYSEGAEEESMSKGRIGCELGKVPLMPGQYTLSLYFGTQAGDTHVELDCLRFEVMERDLWGGAKVPPRGASALWWPAEFYTEAN